MGVVIVFIIGISIVTSLAIHSYYDSEMRSNQRDWEHESAVIRNNKLIASPSRHMRKRLDNFMLQLHLHGYSIKNRELLQEYTPVYVVDEWSRALALYEELRRFAKVTDYDFKQLTVNVPRFGDNFGTHPVYVNEDCCFVVRFEAPGVDIQYVSEPFSERLWRCVKCTITDLGVREAVEKDLAPYIHKNQVVSSEVILEVHWILYEYGILP